MIGIAVFALLILAVSWRAARAADVEHAPYQVVDRFADFEVRDYPATIEARTLVNNDSRRSLSSGFRRLAGYIFGGNQRNQSIAMTAPVTSAPTATGWRMSFVMPASFSLNSLPEPIDGEVELVERPARKMAAIVFSGWATSTVARRMEARLLALLNEAGLEAAGEPVLAQYDPPMQLPFLRRNEVLVPLRGLPVPTVAGPAN